MLLAPRKLIKPWHLTEDECLLVDRVNECAAKVADARPEAVTGSDGGPTRAWKWRTYQVALLYRTVSLFDGAAASIAAESPLVALIAGRALMETIALLGELEVKTRAVLNGGSVESFDQWLFQRIFATRDEAFLNLADEGMPSTKATSILTIMKHFELHIPDAAGYQEVYDQLSEFCHPNAFGHHFMFGRLDRAAHTMRYSEAQDPVSNFGLLLTAMVSIEFVAELLPTFETQFKAVGRIGAPTS